MSTLCLVLSPVAMCRVLGVGGAEGIDVTVVTDLDFNPCLS